MCASCSAMSLSASTTRTTTFARSIACSVFTTENSSTASNTLPLRRIPAVSTSVYCLPSHSSSTSMASRVVPGLSKAIMRSSPSRRLTRVDLPTLGRPMMATRGWSGASSSSGSTSKGASASSMRLLTPSPCSAEIACGSPMASSWNSAVTTSWRMPSVLFTTRITGALASRSIWPMRLSCGERPARPSVTKRITSACAIASRAWRAISE